MKRLTGALIFVFGASLLYLGTFGLQGFGLRMALVGDYFKEDFNDLNQWTLSSGPGVITINPAGVCSFDATGATRYRHNVAGSAFPTLFTVELRLRVSDWASKAEFYLWFQDVTYAHLLSMNATHIRVATPAPAVFVALATDTNWHTWTWTVDVTAAQQRVYRDGTLVGTWNAVYFSGASPSYLSFNSGNSYALKSSMDWLYIDTGLKPPSTPVVRNSLQVKARYGGAFVSGFTVTLSNTTYTYPARTASSTDGVTYLDLATVIQWTAQGSYIGRSASNSTLLPSSPTPYVLLLDFGSPSVQYGSIHVLGYEQGAPVSGFSSWYTNGTFESTHQTATSTDGVTFSSLKTGVTYTIHGQKGSVTASTRDVSVVNPTMYDTSLTFDSVAPQVGSARVLGKQSGAYLSGFEAWLTNSSWSSLHVSVIVPSDGAYFTNLAQGTYTVHGILNSVEAPTNTTTIVLPQSQVPVSILTWSTGQPPGDDWLTYFLTLLKQYLADPTVKAGLQFVGGFFSLMGLLIMAFGGEKKQKQPSFLPSPYW